MTAAAATDRLVERPPSTPGSPPTSATGTSVTVTAASVPAGSAPAASTTAQTTLLPYDLEAPWHFTVYPPPATVPVDQRWAIPSTMPIYSRLWPSPSAAVHHRSSPLRYRP